MTNLTKPLFSIITVVFNDKNGLIQTMESIRKQSDPNFEWLIIDGASTDGTTDILKEHKEMITYQVSEKDKGIYDAMNKGISKASGMYTVFMNAGDVFSSNTVLEDIHKYLQTLDHKPDLVLGGATLILPNGKTLYKSPKPIEKYIWHALPANHQAIYFKTDLIKQTMYDIKYKICGDYYIVAKLFTQKITTSIFNFSLVNFRVGDTSFKNPLKLFKEAYMIQKEVLKSPFFIRIISLIKHIIATTVVFLLSQKYLNKK